MTWLWWAAWAAVPVAFAAEVFAARRVLRAKEPVVEAWLAAGARPHEALARVRSRVRPALVLAVLVLAPALARPPATVPAGFLAALVAIGAAGFSASIFVTLRTFVDSRLVDRPPPEAQAPFRVAPAAPPAVVEVYDTRPPDDRAGHPQN